MFERTLAVFFVLLSCFPIYYFRYRARLSGTPLRGPASPSIIFGVSRMIQVSGDPAALFKNWVKACGVVFKNKTAYGTSQVVICDPKAVAHVFANDTVVYIRPPGFRAMLETLIGKGVIWAEGSDHKRQRKILNPAFSNAAIRELNPLFVDNAHKVKLAWDTILDECTAGGTMIEAHEWANKLSLDSIGSAAFSHNFHAIEGETSPVFDALKVFSEAQQTSIQGSSVLLQLLVPFFMKIPIGRNKLFINLSNAARKIMDDLLISTKRLPTAVAHENAKSTIGLLIEAETSGSKEIDKEEILAQMKGILLAGYDAPSLNLVWILIELARHPQYQARLREEVTPLSDGDFSWDRFHESFPLLDAIVSEVLRLHPAVAELLRQASQDDILPLSEPIVDVNGRIIDHVVIPKGTLVNIPIHCVNRMTEEWGADADDFHPERWLNKIDTEPENHRRHLTFGDGPRTCLGKSFALAQNKVVIAILVRHYTFELPSGPSTKLETHFGLMARPKVKGEVGGTLPLRVRRVL